MALWWICGWYLWLRIVRQYNFTASLIKALHALTRVSISSTKGKTRILDVELQNKILLCVEEKSRVISAVCAAQALGDRCLASINIPISAPALQTTFSLSTEMSSEWRSGRSPAMRASSAWAKGEPCVSLVVKKTWTKQNTNNFKWIWIIWNERCCVSEQLVCLPGLYVPGEDGNSKTFCHQMVLTLMNMKNVMCFQLALHFWTLLPRKAFVQTPHPHWQQGLTGWQTQLVVVCGLLVFLSLIYLISIFADCFPPPYCKIQVTQNESTFCCSLHP